MGGAAGGHAGEADGRAPADLFPGPRASALESVAHHPRAPVDDGEVGCARSGAVLEPVAVSRRDFVVLEFTPEPIALPSTTLPRKGGGAVLPPA